MAAALHLFNHQTSRPFHPELWQRVAERALPLCVSVAKDASAPLLHLEEIEFSLVSDDAISRVHADFMDDPTPTDVITFHHGEIIISLDTAAAQAAEHLTSYETEVALYIVHGLLHLAGWEDTEPTLREEMHAVQARILQECLRG